MKKTDKHYKIKDLEIILNKIGYSNWAGWITATNNYLDEKGIKTTEAIKDTKTQQQIKQYLNKIKDYRAITIVEFEEN